MIDWEREKSDETKMNRLTREEHPLTHIISASSEVHIKNKEVES